MQPDAVRDDRQRIIEAAYSCLSEPHEGPVPVAAILQRAGVSSRAFYRHFASKDELFLAMLRQETDALADRLDRVVAETGGTPTELLEAWIDEMLEVVSNDEIGMHFAVIDSDEIRVAKGYRETREKAHADRERSLVKILRLGSEDGSFPLTDPDNDAVAINAIISRVLPDQLCGSHQGIQHAKARVLDFALRALGAKER
ncbi:TetR/AcrR family transcriptional regulator [Mycolicibacterium phlei]